MTMQRNQFESQEQSLTKLVCDKYFVCVLWLWLCVFFGCGCVFSLVVAVCFLVVAVGVLFWRVVSAVVAWLWRRFSSVLA